MLLYVKSKLFELWKIPLKIVRFLDEADQVNVDTSIPPRFECEKCNGKMVPKFYIGS